MKRMGEKRGKERKVEGKWEKGKGKGKGKGRGRWKEDKLNSRKVGLTDARTDTRVILYCPTLCIALDRQ